MVNSIDSTRSNRSRQSHVKTVSPGAFSFYCRGAPRYWLCAIRIAICTVMLVPMLAVSGDNPEPEPLSVSDFYITITADDLYLCGEGFGGIYGCIDEAVSREAKSVVISASSDATVQAVQELIHAVHSVGFDQVGVASLTETDT